MPGTYFYPRSPCGERQYLFVGDSYSMGISIHALLAESDRSVSNTVTPPSPFLSTLSLRRATSPKGGQYSVYSISIHALLAESDAQKRYHGSPTAGFLSTLSLRRATDIACGDRHKLCHFYPRSPCGERRSVSNTVTPPSPFLSTLSLRRATKPAEIGPNLVNNFYPRSPCGERP